MNYHTHNFIFNALFQYNNLLKFFTLNKIYQESNV